MRIRFSHILTLAALMTLLSGCKKNNPDIQNPEVGFPLGANIKNEIIIRPSATTQLISDVLLVSLETAAVAKSDIHITIADSSTVMVNAYNTANGTSIQKLPVSFWSIPPELVIKKGERSAKADISIASTLSLNFNQQYAIGIKIVNASTGNPIAATSGNLFIVFSIMNSYDGRYKMVGQYLHPTYEPTFAHHFFDVELHTTGPNTVKLYWPYAGSYNLPLTVFGDATCCFSAEVLSIDVDSITNAASCLNTCPPCNYVFSPISSYNNNIYTNKWVPSSRAFYIAFGYNLSPNNTIVFGSSRAWIDTLTYLGPR